MYRYIDTTRAHVDAVAIAAPIRPRVVVASSPRVAH